MICGRTCKCVCNCRTLIEFRFQAVADEKISPCYRKNFHDRFALHLAWAIQIFCSVCMGSNVSVTVRLELEKEMHLYN
jgi:hypothetical protein